MCTGLLLYKPAAPRRRDGAPTRPVLRDAAIGRICRRIQNAELPRLFFAFKMPLLVYVVFMAIGGSAGQSVADWSAEKFRRVAAQPVYRSRPSAYQQRQTVDWSRDAAPPPSSIVKQKEANSEESRPRSRAFGASNYEAQPLSEHNNPYISPDVNQPTPPPRLPFGGPDPLNPYVNVPGQFSNWPPHTPQSNFVNRLPSNQDQVPFSFNRDQSGGGQSQSYDGGATTPQVSYYLPNQPAGQPTGEYSGQGSNDHETNKKPPVLLIGNFPPFGSHGGPQAPPQIFPYIPPPATGAPPPPPQNGAFNYAPPNPPLYRPNEAAPPAATPNEYRNPYNPYNSRPPPPPNRAVPLPAPPPEQYQGYNPQPTPAYPSEKNLPNPEETGYEGPLPGGPGGPLPKGPGGPLPGGPGGPSPEGPGSPSPGGPEGPLPGGPEGPSPGGAGGPLPGRPRGPSPGGARGPLPGGPGGPLPGGLGGPSPGGPGGPLPGGPGGPLPGGPGGPLPGGPGGPLPGGPGGPLPGGPGGPSPEGPGSPSPGGPEGPLPGGPGGPLPGGPEGPSPGGAGGPLPGGPGGPSPGGLGGPSPGGPGGPPPGSSPPDFPGVPPPGGPEGPPSGVPGIPPPTGGPPHGVPGFPLPAGPGGPPHGVPGGPPPSVSGLPPTRFPGAPPPAGPSGPPHGVPRFPPPGVPGFPSHGMPGAPPPGGPGAPPPGAPEAPPPGGPGSPSSRFPGAPPPGRPEGPSPGGPEGPPSGVPGSPPTRFPGAPPPAGPGGPPPGGPRAPPPGVPGAPPSGGPGSPPTEFPHPGNHGGPPPSNRFPPLTPPPQFPTLITTPSPGFVPPREEFPPNFYTRPPPGGPGGSPPPGFSPQGPPTGFPPFGRPGEPPPSEFPPRGTPPDSRSTPGFPTSGGPSPPPLNVSTLLPPGPPQTTAPPDQMVPNKIRGKARVVCEESGMQFTVNTIFPFTGQIFAYDRKRVPNCVHTFNEATNVSVSFSYAECGIRNAGNETRTHEQFHLQIIVEFEQPDRSTTVQSFIVQCAEQKLQYNKQTIPKRIEEALEELRLVPTQLEQKAPVPDCLLRIVTDVEHHKPGDGVDVDEVDVGQPLRVELSLQPESDAYGFLVRNCVVRDIISGMQHEVIDSRGCSTDLNIFAHPHYDTYHDVARVHWHAFKLPDHTRLSLTCQFDICLDISDETGSKSCASIPTPPFCADIVTSPSNSILFDATGFARSRRSVTSNGGGVMQKTITIEFNTTSSGHTTETDPTGIPEAEETESRPAIERLPTLFSDEASSQPSKTLTLMHSVHAGICLSEKAEITGDAKSNADYCNSKQFESDHVKHLQKIALESRPAVKLPAQTTCASGWPLVTVIGSAASVALSVVATLLNIIVRLRRRLCAAKMTISVHH